MLTARHEESAVAPARATQARHESSRLQNVLLPLLVIFLGFGVSLWRLGRTPLYDTEAFYAETGREMLESKDRLTPTFDYDRFLDKPPLYYWSLLPAYHFLGTTERAARLPAALALTGCVGLTVLAGILLFDATTAWLAGLFFTTTMGFFVYSHDVLVEPMLALWITASLASFWGFYKNPARKIWLWAMYMFLALGLLTKGLTALVFPLATIAAFLILTGGARNLKPLLSWKGWLLFLGISAPWYVWTTLHNPEYLWFYFVNEQLLRFLALRAIKDAPFPTYVFLGLLIPILFPWSFYLPQSFHFHIRQRREQKAFDEPVLFVLLWAAVVLGFFSLSRFKLDYYSLPAWPALILLIAHSLSNRLRQPDSGLVLLPPVALIILLSAIGFLALPTIVDSFHLQLPDPWFLKATRQTFAWLFVGSAAAALFLSLRRSKAALLCLAAMMLPIMALAQQAMLLLGPSLSNKELAQAAGRCLDSLRVPGTLVQAETDEDIYVGGDVFYTGRKVWLVMPLEKQVFLLGRKFYMTPQEFSLRWRAKEPVLLIGKSDRAAKLVADSPRYMLAQSGGKVLLSNQPVCGARKPS